MGKKVDRTEITIEKQKLNAEALALVRRDLLFHDWSVLIDMSVDGAYSYLVNTIMETLDVYAPRKQIKIRACDKFHEPWMTVKIKKFNQKCRKLCEHARVSKLETNHKKYKQYRNMLNRIKRLE